MVSSIDHEGRLHFRGAGQRTWPDSVSLLCRATETGSQAEAWRDRALAAASRRDGSSSSARSLSSHKWRLLEPWRVREREVLERDVDALRGVIETATDEAAIQRHLQQRPWLLASLLGGGHGRWVRPQVSLGGEVVADFFIADADSVGVRWRLIELESPRARQRLKNGEFAKEARHAIHQIEHWRSWLSANTELRREGHLSHHAHVVGGRAGPCGPPWRPGTLRSRAAARDARRRRGR